MENKATILIVDDDPLITMIILQVVTRAMSPAAQIFTASNGEEGLRKALETRPDLIITDLMMPKMDGYEMVQSLRREQANCQARIIGVTCGSPTDARTQAFSKLCDNFLAKPFMPKELTEKLDMLSISPKQPGCS